MSPVPASTWVRTPADRVRLATVSVATPLLLLALALLLLEIAVRAIGNAFNERTH